MQQIDRPHAEFLQILAQCENLTELDATRFRQTWSNYHQYFNSKRKEIVFSGYNLDQESLELAKKIEGSGLWIYSVVRGQGDMFIEQSSQRSLQYDNRNFALYQNIFVPQVLEQMGLIRTSQGGLEGTKVISLESSSSDKEPDVLPPDEELHISLPEQLKKMQELHKQQRNKEMLSFEWCGLLSLGEQFLLACGGKLGNK